MSASTIETPCINVCVLDLDTGLCMGCGRSGEEIGGWLALSPGKRRVVMAELPARLATMAAERRRKGGAAARRSRMQAEVDGR